MFGIGGMEFFLICLFGLLIFGPDKMPQLGRTLGRTLRQFNKVQDDMKRIVNAEMYAKDPQKDTSPFKPKESVLTNTDSGEKVVAAPAAATSQAASLYGLEDKPAEATSAPEPVEAVVATEDAESVKTPEATNGEGGETSK